MAVSSTAARPRAARSDRWRFTADQFVAMYAAGVLASDQNTELIGGEVFRVPPPGPLHASAQVWITSLFVRRLEDRAVVWLDNAVRLGSESVVQPDVAILRLDPDAYCHRLPAAADVLLAVEIAESSLSRDRRLKLPLYARHGIPEVWLVALSERRVEVHRQPRGRRFADVAVRGPGEHVAPLCAPDVAVDVGEVLRMRFRGEEG